ncbi:MAG: amino acid ABC transporter ATP-binding protein [Bacteroidales bacterium]|nr:amino acid ABC transporter ATP-binding protein [Bacteroidales bacterium]
MISIRHLCKSFVNPDGSCIDVLKDVSCEIHKGEVVGIIGPSGCGKSALLRTINLMTPPTSGEILFEGKNITAKGYPINRLRQRMGMVFQTFNLFEHLNVLGNVTLGPMKLKGVSQAEAEREAMQYLHKVGMDDMGAVMPADLSGGQKQRVAIARCLAMHPDVMLFDEPLSALDPSMVGEVQSVIRQLAHEGMTMLIATHRLKFARDVSTRILFMNHGEIHEDGTPQQIFENPIHSATKAFVQQIYKLWFTIEGPDFDIVEMHSQMLQFCNKYNIADIIIPAQQIINMMVLIVLTDYRPLTVRLSYIEQFEQVTLDFMIEGLTTSPLANLDFGREVLEDIRTMSHKIIEEPTKRGFRIKVIL